ncbi:MAG: ATP-binding cassette domain-containing protein [Acidobacteria bacterium]|nr:ATP-binding cassette domain-containing protein [Acidobacteriota bacterium]MBU4253914.1 ATP-binding cassette domain-containing protein [Acidobacteriota bacterium]MBU4330847.1 ATP-binding cassette domain-containing protein [Acidobacteriota bacterium]MBU4494592.1 ATP-binding cassette domain-containing protein [Acidobacteriota bacterium]MCG2816191.1 ATP-binding cassette domain-containing protein [Candidatus Aminicenantes bacterium]
MIEINNLSFNYGRLKVFDGFNLQIPKGQVCLITGINGVGKSTLLRLVARVLNPLSGEIRFPQITSPDPRSKIGFISDTLSLYQNLKVSQAIDFHKSVYKIQKFDDSLISHTKIKKNQRIKELSNGQKTIFHLSLILSAQPDIFLIDEVIHSIDAYLRKVFLEKLIDLLTEKKLTVIMVNLNFYDIENMIDRVILLKDGKTAVDEKIDDLKTKVKKITSSTQPKNIPILTEIHYSDHADYYVYPYETNDNDDMEGEIIDLDLTEIITAFIGGEYA